MCKPSRRLARWGTVPGLILFALLGGSAQCHAAIRPQVITTVFPTEDVVIASVVVTAPREGTGDAAPAIQAAIDEAAAAGGGVVFLPVGRYRLAGRLVLKEGVTLRGDWQPPTWFSNPPRRSSPGTLLMPTADRGNPEAPAAITLERGSGLREVTIWYPEQNPAAVVPYPWTLRTSTTVGGDNYTVQNVTLVNPYQAIKIGPEGNELHTIRNVCGTPLKTGIWIDSTTDIGRLNEVDFGARWWEESGLPGAPTTEAQQTALRDYLRREGTAFDMGRSDWEYLYRIRAAGYGTGLTVHQGKLGTTNAVMFGCELTDCGTALRLERLNGVGLSVTGGRLTGRDYAVHAPRSFSTVAQFHSCEFGGPAPRAVLLEGTGTLTFQNCTFASWGKTALEARAGSISLLDCNFAQKGSHVKLGEGIRRARLLGNRFDGEPGIDSKGSAGDVQISQRDFGFAHPDLTPQPAHRDPRPATRQLFTITDYGAATAAADNTEAFARALSAAGKAGGGTVYVPAGNYRCRGNLVVPAGVELRGNFDVPHHTVSGGSVLLVTADRGKADGTPFIRLAPGSGLRGLTFWYPEQNLRDVAPYPWTIQATGPRCWLLDVTLGNAYQGVDFWSHPSDGHVIRYLAGCVLKRGLFVSKAAGEGWVEDVQFNPHYALRVPNSLPRPAYAGDMGSVLIDYLRANLDGIVIGRCANEHLRGTFLYAAHDGIAFRDDGGGANARVIQHGTDTGSRAAVLAATGERGVEFIEAQLVPLGKYEVGGIIAEEGFRGKAAFFNTQMWAGTVSGIIGGQGEVLLQQINTLSGGLTFQGGRCTLENAVFERNLEPHVRVAPQCAGARLLANVSGGQFRIENGAGERCTARMNSLSPLPPVNRFTFRTGWEQGEPQGLADTVAVPGGGQHAVSKGECHPVTEGAHAGKGALRLAGNADDPEYAYSYYKLFAEPLAVNPDTVLTYWICPLNERGRSSGIDLVFADGSTLRDSDTKTSDGGGVHPSGAKGAVGKWTKISIPLGSRHAGKEIAAILFAYDDRGEGGPFAALFDDLAIESAEADLPWRVQASLPGGAQPVGARVALQSPDGAVIRYTLDGTAPRADSPRYEKPIVLNRPGLWEVRFAAQAADGRMSSRAFAELYEVQ